MTASERPDPGEAAAGVRRQRVEGGMSTVWGEAAGVTWANAPDATKESFTLVRLFWFFRMVAIGGPDGSDLDQAVSDEAREAAEWFGPILERRGEAGK